MTDNIPKWPESLPPPFEVVEGPRQVYFCESDFDGDDGVRDLLHDLYWFPDDNYYLYFLHGEGLDKSLASRLEAQGIEMKKTELYFYRHPNPAYPNDFIRVLNHEDPPQWKADAAKGPMFGRVSMSLEPARRKQIDFQENARITRELIADSESVVEAKPNFFGMGLNLNSLWHKVRKRLRRR